MDYTDKDLSKTSDIKREATISKLHNMQWLKSTLHSADPGKAKSACKRDHNANNKTEDKVLLTKHGQTHLVEVSGTYCSTGKYEEHISDSVMSENNNNVCNKDVTELLPSIMELVIHKDKERDTLNIVENIAATKLKAKIYTDEESADAAQKKSTDNTVVQIACRNLVNDLEPQKVDQDTENIDSIKQCDDSNTDSKCVTLSASETDDKEKTIDVENKTMEAKDKDGQIKTSTDELKSNMKNEENATLSQNHDESSSAHSKKAVSNSSKSTVPVNKNAKVDRSNNKHTYARNIACIRREEFVKQRSVSRDGVEKDEKKDVASRSSISKTDVDAELNKSNDTTSQSKNTNRNKTPQKQILFKQFVMKTKSQESFRKSISNSEKDNTLEKTENGMHASKASVSEKKNQKVIGEKNSRHDQKVNHGVRRSTTFVTQYKNSTFSNKQGGDGLPNKTDYTLSYRRNSVNAHNDSRSDKDQINDVECKIVLQREYTSTNSKFNRGIKEPRASDTKDHVKRQNETDASAYNYKDAASSVQTGTQLIENKAPVNDSHVDKAEQKSTTTEQSREETKVTEKPKVDVNQQVVVNKVIDKEPNTPTHDNKYIAGSQTDAMHLKSESTQWTNTKQLENNQIWCNVPPAIQRNTATSANSQQPVQNMQYFNMQQQIGAQADDIARQMWTTDYGRYYEQYFAPENLMRLEHISNMAFDVASYGNNLQTHIAPNDSNVAVSPSTLEMMDRNRESSNAPYKYIPHVHPRPVSSLSNFTDYPMLSTHGNKWSLALQEASIHMEQPAYNVTQQPTQAMQVYRSGPDDFNTTNCLPQPIVYTPCMQAWNPQLQYPIPIFYNAPYASYAILPDTMNQPNDDDGSMHQQPKYIPHPQMNSYVRNARDYDSNSCATQPRSTFDSVKPSQYYRRYPDNSRAAYDVPRNVPPVPYSRSQQGMNFVPTSTNMSQRNTSYSQNPKYYRQSASSRQMPKKPYDQRIQDFVCDDNAQEDIPPMISPKEFITSNMNLPNKNDQFATQPLKADFKMNPSADYHPPLWQRYSNNNFRRNTTPDFSRDDGSPISIGRGMYKSKKL